MGVGQRIRPALMLVLLLSLAPGSAVAAEATEGDETVGRDVFQANCAMCHGSDASGMMGMHPSLRGAVERLTLEGVDVTIRNGRDTRPPMPAFEGRLSDEEIADVISYLDSLPVGPRNFGPGDGGMMDDGKMPDRDTMGRGGRRGGDMMDGGMMGGAVMMLLVALFVLALTVLAVAAIVWVVRQSRGNSSGSAGLSPARQELDRRYAVGELNRDQYLERRRDLES